MKIAVDGRALKAALAAVKPVVRKSSHLPILSCVRLETVEGALNVTSTSIDATVAVTVPADVTEPGVTVLPHAQLCKLVPPGACRITGDDQQATIAGAVTSTVAVMQAADWPADPHVGLWTDPAPLDLTALRSVLPAASVDQGIPLLCGVHVDGDTYVATDKYRLHVCTTAGPALDGSVLIPNLIAQAVAKTKSDATVSVCVTDGASTCPVAVRVHAGSTTWTARAPQGNYPNWRQLIIDSPGWGYEMNGPAVAAACKALAPVCGDHRSVQVTSGRLTVSGDGNGQGSHSGGGEATVPIEPYGDPPAVNYNPAYLGALVAGLPSARLALVDAVKQSIVRHTDEAGRKHTRLIMPVRVPA